MEVTAATKFERRTYIAEIPKRYRKEFFLDYKESLSRGEKEGFFFLGVVLVFPLESIVT